MNPQQHHLAAYVGIDWADQQHPVCLPIHAHSPRRSQTLDQTPESLTAWALQLKEPFPDGPTGVCLECVGSGMRPNKKSHPHGWLDLFVSRFAKLAYAASLRFRQA